MRKSTKKEPEPTQESMNEEKSPAAEFARAHWKEALIISGTLAGAVIFLLIRYHKRKKLDAGDKSQDKELDVLEREAVRGTYETEVLLETGTFAVNHIAGAREITLELAKGLSDKFSDEDEEILAEKPAVEQRGRRPNRKNPKNTMNTLGNIV